jgi:hypothetical protein
MRATIWARGVRLKPEHQLHEPAAESPRAVGWTAVGDGRLCVC